MAAAAIGVDREATLASRPGRVLGRSPRSDGDQVRGQDCIDQSSDRRLLLSSLIEGGAAGLSVASFSAYEAPA